MAGLDLPGGDVTIPGLGSQPIVLVAAVAGGTLGLGVLLYRRVHGTGDAGAPVAAVETPKDGPTSAAVPASGASTDSIGALAASLSSGLADQTAQTAKALADQQAATTKALADQQAASQGSIDTLFGLFTQDAADREARDQAARDSQAARDAAQDAAQQSWWEKIAAQLGKNAPVDPVIPTPSTGGGGGAYTAADWEAFAANAGALYDLKRQGAVVPAGGTLTPYEGSKRLSNAVINLPKAYTPANDTKGFEFLGKPQEILLVRAARKTADYMGGHLAADPQAIMLGILRSESKSSGGWAGTGFAAGPADVSAGYP